MTRLFTILAALFAIFAVAPASAGTAAPPVSADASGLAIGGYDPVAFFTQGKALPGKGAFETRYQGATWRFAAAEAHAAFKAAPDRYAPQFGGYCAWAVSQHYLAPGDANFWKIVHGKLYLNFNARAKELWESDQAESIARGHANWPAVLTDNQDKASGR